MTKAEALEFFAPVFGGEHHVPKLIAHGNGWKINVGGGRLATFDFNGLTELVFRAHDMCCRVEVTQGGPGKVGVVVFKRDGREGRGWARHPTLEQAVAQWRALRLPTRESLALERPHPFDAECDEHGAYDRCVCGRPSSDSLHAVTVPA